MVAVVVLAGKPSSDPPIVGAYVYFMFLNCIRTEGPIITQFYI